MTLPFSPSQGFVSGITGIVTKPIKGAQKEGAAGFFKGVGKGLVGAVARPTGGIIDMASSTFQGIKRAAETSQDVESLRPPRFIHEDGVIRPYKEREGIGSQMLQVTGILGKTKLTLISSKQMAPLTRVVFIRHQMEGKKLTSGRDYTNLSNKKRSSSFSVAKLLKRVFPLVS